jgi:hypothetical protein
MSRKAQQRLKIEDLVLGEEFQDTITSFKGFATSKHSYINGCHQIGLTRKIGKPGEDIKVLSFDIERLKRIGKGVSEDFKPADLSSPGGPGDHLAAAGPSH